MPVFITQGRYTSDAYHGLVTSPDDRHEAVSHLLEAGGCKLIDMYSVSYTHLTLPTNRQV